MGPPCCGPIAPFAPTAPHVLCLRAYIVAFLMASWVLSLGGCSSSPRPVETADADDFQSPLESIEQPKRVGPPDSRTQAAILDSLPGDPDDPIWATFYTSLGSIVCHLKTHYAPQTVANFVGLATGELPYIDPRTDRINESPYYDDVPFHRVLPGRLIQAGDPTGRGDLGPGYHLPIESSPDLSHDRPGILSTARDGDQASGSQFLITEAPMPELDGHHTIFGHCQDLDIIRRISHAPTDPLGRPSGTPPVIDRVEVWRGHHP